MSSPLKNSLPRSAAPEQLQFNFDAPATAVAERDRCVEPLLTIAEASALFNLKPHVLRRAIKSKSIPVYQIGNGRIRLRASDITAAIDASRQGSVK